MKTPITKLIKLSLTATLFGLCVLTPLVAGLHGNSHAFGKTAGGWIEVYERWAFGELAVPIDENGNAVVDRHVVLMPIPNTPGDGTPGHIDLTLDAGQERVLRLCAFLGTDCSDGTPAAPPCDCSSFQTRKLPFQID